MTVRPRERNPYRAEIAGTVAFAPLVLGIEAWRRRGDLLAPEALDDAVVFGAALFVARGLARRDPAAPARWVFVCGGAWFLFLLSLWGSIHAFDRPDPSGVPIAGVLAFKLIGFLLISWAARRAVGRVRAVDPYGRELPIGSSSRSG